MQTEVDGDNESGEDDRPATGHEDRLQIEVLVHLVPEWYNLTAQSHVGKVVWKV